MAHNYFLDTRYIKHDLFPIENNTKRLQYIPPLAVSVLPEYKLPCTSHSKNGSVQYRTQIVNSHILHLTPHYTYHLCHNTSKDIRCVEYLQIFSIHMCAHKYK